MTTFAVTELSEADQCFVAYAAHELRGSITVQRTLAEVALADPKADTASLRRMGEEVAAACEQQARLLDALLTLAWSQHGHLRSEPVDLAAVADEVLCAHDRRGLTSTAALEPAVTTGDPRLIERLVANLVANAIRHNIPGGWLDVATYTAEGRVCLTVMNTGPVIPTAELARLFQPFHRFTAHACSTANGFGLGLAIVQAIADAHDVAVDAQARRDGGLRIDVDFPAASCLNRV